MSIFVKGKSKYVISEIDKKTYCKTNGHFTKYLNSINLSEKEYCIQFENIKIRKCDFCENHSYFDMVSWAFVDTCRSKECTDKKRVKTLEDPKVKQKFSENAKRNWDNPEIRQKTMDSIENTMRAVGEDGLTGYERAYQKSKVAKLEKYGNEFYSNSEKAKSSLNSRTDEQWAITNEKRNITLLNKPIEEKEETKKKVSSTVMERYGVPWATYIAGKSQKSNRFSKPEIEICEYFESFLGKNCFHSSSEKGQLRLDNNFYDFCFQNKIIEFNGDFWHANPEKYNKDFINPFSKKTAFEVWKRDEHRIAIAKLNGYDVKIIWESHYKQNKNKILQECIEWLNS